MQVELEVKSTPKAQVTPIPDSVQRERKPSTMDRQTTRALPMGATGARSSPTGPAGLTGHPGSSLLRPHTHCRPESRRRRPLHARSLDMPQNNQEDWRLGYDLS